MTDYSCERTTTGAQVYYLLLRGIVQLESCLVKTKLLLLTEQKVCPGSWYPYFVSRPHSPFSAPSGRCLSDFLDEADRDGSPLPYSLGVKFGNLANERVTCVRPTGGRRLACIYHHSLSFETLSHQLQVLCICSCHRGSGPHNFGSLSQKTQKVRCRKGSQASCRACFPRPTVN